MTDPLSLWLPLPDAPAFPAAGYAPLADGIARLLGTRNDVLLIQGEAVVALEATAASLGRPGLRALNVVTSMYGRWFGAWLRRAGAEVRDLAAPAGLPFAIDGLAEALGAGRVRPRRPRPRRKRLWHPQSAGGGCGLDQGARRAPGGGCRRLGGRTCARRGRARHRRGGDRAAEGSGRPRRRLGAFGLARRLGADGAIGRGALDPLACRPARALAGSRSGRAPRHALGDRVPCARPDPRPRGS